MTQSVCVRLLARLGLSRKVSEKVSKIDLETRKREKVRVTKEDIKKGLAELGLKRGDVVGVHSSLSSFGYVEGGADTVIDALLETVGEEGAVVMPTYSTNREDVQRTPEEVKLGVTWKARILPYNPKTTPSKGDTENEFVGNDCH